MHQIPVFFDATHFWVVLQFCECASIFAFLFYTPYKLIRPQIYQLYCVIIMVYGL